MADGWNADNDGSGPSTSQVFSALVRRVLGHELGIGDDWIHIGKILGILYTLPNRHYHTNAHILRMFADAEKYGLELNMADKLAIIFHDAIYQPGQGNNEARSCALFDCLMGLYFDKESHHAVTSRIMSTSRFLDTAREIPEDEINIRDLDLVSLADDWDDFMVADKQLRDEFGANMGERALFLDQLAGRPVLFYKLTQLEEAARANIARYVDEFMPKSMKLVEEE